VELAVAISDVEVELTAMINVYLRVKALPTKINDLIEEAHTVLGGDASVSSNEDGGLSH
jgi:hypothetical protein